MNSSVRGYAMRAGNGGFAPRTLRTSATAQLRRDISRRRDARPCDPFQGEQPRAGTLKSLPISADFCQFQQSPRRQPDVPIVMRYLDEVDTLAICIGKAQLSL